MNIGMVLLHPGSCGSRRSLQNADIMFALGYMLQRVRANDIDDAAVPAAKVTSRSC
jgi:hypothetical protein